MLPPEIRRRSCGGQKKLSALARQAAFFLAGRKRPHTAGVSGVVTLGDLGRVMTRYLNRLTGLTILGHRTRT